MIPIFIVGDFPPAFIHVTFGRCKCLRYQSFDVYDTAQPQNKNFHAFYSILAQCKTLIKRISLLIDVPILPQISEMRVSELSNIVGHSQKVFDDIRLIDPTFTLLCLVAILSDITTVNNFCFRAFIVALLPAIFSK